MPSRVSAPPPATTITPRGAGLAAGISAPLSIRRASTPAPASQRSAAVSRSSSPVSSPERASRKQKPPAESSSPGPAARARSSARAQRWPRGV